MLTMRAFAVEIRREIQMVLRKARLRGLEVRNLRRLGGDEVTLTIPIWVIWIACGIVCLIILLFAFIGVLFVMSIGK